MMIFRYSDFVKRPGIFLCSLRICMKATQPSPPYVFGGGPDTGKNLDSRQKHSEMTTSGFHALVCPVPVMGVSANHPIESGGGGGEAGIRVRKLFPGLQL